MQVTERGIRGRRSGWRLRAAVTVLGLVAALPGLRRGGIPAAGEAGEGGGQGQDLTRKVEAWAPRS